MSIQRIQLEEKAGGRSGHFLRRNLEVSPTLSRADANPLSLQNLYAPIARELQQVEDILRQELRSEYVYVDELVRYGCLLGGKRLRPALVLLCGQAVGTCGTSTWRSRRHRNGPHRFARARRCAGRGADSRHLAPSIRAGTQNERVAR